MAEDVPENHVVSEDVGMLTGVTELRRDIQYLRDEMCYSSVEKRRENEGIMLHSAIAV